MRADFNHKKFLVLAGNPRERVDPFRFYANDTIAPASAMEVVRQLCLQGAGVTVIAPADARLKMDGVTFMESLADGKKIESARDMLAACTALVEREHYDVVLSLAGISSITCPAPSAGKIQKTDAGQRAHLFNVVGNIDVKSHLARVWPHATIAGFDQHQQWFALGDAALTAMVQSWLGTVPASAAVPAPAAVAPEDASLVGRRVIVTTGRTEEILTQGGDKITNFFSGRQGQAIARACLEAGG